MTSLRIQAQPFYWVAVTVAVACAALALVLPSPCAFTQQCADTHYTAWTSLSRYATCTLTTALILEVVALRLTFRSAQPLVGIVRGIEYTFVPPVLLSVTLGVLILENLCISLPWLVHAAADGVGAMDGRPVYSMVYIEWLINVPILIGIVGSCALGRSLEEVSRPLVVTNLYIVLSWTAYFQADTAVRWSFVATAFSMYFWASRDMACWVFKFWAASKPDLPSRNLRAGMSFGLIAIFGVYGLVYILAMLGMISSRTELVAYLGMNIGSKLTMLLAFVGIRSSQFFDLLVSLIVNKYLPFQRQVAVNDTPDTENPGSLPLLQ